MTQPFDPLAPTYDSAFTGSPIGRFLRARVHDRLNRHFHAGDHILELGCGTGEDARYLAQRGVRVTATDSSQAMLAVARAKAADHPLVTFAPLDLRHLPPHSSVLSPQPSEPTPQNLELRTQNLAPSFSGAFSNFGPLNCLDDWKPLASWLAGLLKPGAVVGLGVMSPLCLWEPLWHGLHGDFRTATRRWRKSTRFRPQTVSTVLHKQEASAETDSPFLRIWGKGDGGIGVLSISITYPTIRRLTRDFAPGFRRTYVQPLGLFLPPSDVFGALEKRPRLLRLLLALETRFAHASVLAPFADHYWIEFTRR